MSDERRVEENIEKVLAASMAGIWTDFWREAVCRDIDRNTARERKLRTDKLSRKGYQNNCLTAYLTIRMFIKKGPWDWEIVELGRVMLESKLVV